MCVCGNGNYSTEVDSSFGLCLPKIILIKTGPVVINTIPIMMYSKLFLTHSLLPRTYPRNIKLTTQANEPTTLYKLNLALSIFTIPATIGANVRTIGKKRAITIAKPPLSL
jgi:hypothetical protein